MTSLKIYKDGLNAEVDFLLKVQFSLDEKRYSVEKTTYEFDPVDYVIKKDGVLLCYVELKTRFIDLSKYDSLMIGSVKLKNIQKLPMKTYLLWDSKDAFHYIQFKHELLEVNSTYINNSKVSFVPKIMCKTSYDAFIEEIVSL